MGLGPNILDDNQIINRKTTITQIVCIKDATNRLRCLTSINYQRIVKMIFPLKPSLALSPLRPHRQTDSFCSEVLVKRRSSVH